MATGMTGALTTEIASRTCMEAKEREKEISRSREILRELTGGKGVCEIDHK
jgi:hypothetical protein